METNNQRKQFTGVVSSNKMDKTVVVSVKRRVPHPVYKKFVNKTKKATLHAYFNGQMTVSRLVYILNGTQFYGS